MMKILNKKPAVALLMVVVLALMYFFVKSFSPQPLAVISTVPSDDTSHNPFLPVTITFNRQPKNGEVVVSFDPETEVTERINGATIELIPTYTYTEQVQYHVTVNTKPQYVFTFVTEQIGSNAPGWNEMFDAAEKQYRSVNAAQDKALELLRTTAPHKEPGFSVNYTYKTNTFVIELSAPYETNKTKFLDWINARGVSDLSTVRIEYINN